MKKTAIIVVLVWCLILSLVWPFRIRSHADGLTMPMIVSSTYAISQDAGLSWLFSGMTGQDALSYLEGQINSWLGGHTIAEKFGADILRIVGGKLVVPYELYNGIAEFLADFNANLDYSGDSCLMYVNLGDKNFVPAGIYTYVNSRGQTIEQAEYTIIDSSTGTSVTKRGGEWAPYNELTNDGLAIIQNGSWTTVRGIYSYKPVSSRVTDYVKLAEVQGAIKDIAIENSDYIAPTVIDPSQSWVGQFDNIPDTNLDDLLGDILDDIADNNLVVDGEVTDAPVPPGPVPTWTPVDDVIDGINQQGEILEGIGNDIGDISGHLDDIGDRIDDVTGALEGVQEGIYTQTGVISGAIDQATSDVVDAIGEQTATLDQTLTETAEGIQDIVDALEPGQITPQQFDLRRLFPFCIPFDIHNLLQKFDAEPVAPHVQLPFVIQSIGFSYTFDLDFSAFNSVAEVMRTVEFIVFAIGLAWATSKVIKW